MNTPEWLRPGIYGALIGAAFVGLAGFTWGGWVTGGTAQDRALAMSREGVVAAMVPVCLDLAKNDPNRIEKLAAIREKSSFQRREALMETGWATVPGAEMPNRDIARACLASLDVDAVPETPAVSVDEG
jgi:hypothetical protein